jgi:hypothetical protein
LLYGRPELEFWLGTPEERRPFTEGKAMRTTRVVLYDNIVCLLD